MGGTHTGVFTNKAISEEMIDDLVNPRAEFDTIPVRELRPQKGNIRA
jgi:hypothetical protein